MDELVQMTMSREISCRAVGPLYPGRLLWVLRRELLKRMHKRSGRELSPLECRLENEELATFEAGLERLSEHRREAIMLSIEMGFADAQVAEAMNMVSENEARAMVRDGLVCLALERAKELTREMAREPARPSADTEWLGRYVPYLLRWAKGRMSRHRLDLSDPADLVQKALLRALYPIDRFEPRQPGALLMSLRRIMLNMLRDEEHRWSDSEPSPLERSTGRDRLAAYEAALERLAVHQQEAIVLKIELGMSHTEVADAMGLASPNAARMLVARGLAGLVQE